MIPGFGKLAVTLLVLTIQTVSSSGHFSPLIKGSKMARLLFAFKHGSKSANSKELDMAWETPPKSVPLASETEEEQIISDLNCDGEHSVDDAAYQDVSLKGVQNIEFYGKTQVNNQEDPPVKSSDYGTLSRLKARGRPESIVLNNITYEWVGRVGSMIRMTSGEKNLSLQIRSDCEPEHFLLQEFVLIQRLALHGLSPSPLFISDPEAVDDDPYLECHRFRRALLLERSGEDLNELKKKTPEGILSPREAITVGIQLVETLRRLHELQSAHGDLSPKNVVVSMSGSRLLLQNFPMNDAGSNFEKNSISDAYYILFIIFDLHPPFHALMFSGSPSTSDLAEIYRMTSGLKGSSDIKYSEITARLERALGKFE